MQPHRVLRPLALALIPLLALLVARQGGAAGVVDLAGVPQVAELDFEVRAPGGATIPARLTFVSADGGARELFQNVAAAPQEFAARANVLYAKRGTGLVTVPPGRYAIYASRGPEWSLSRTELELVAGQRASLRVELMHELDTHGWIGADFHLHTLTHSGHGDANLEERLLACLGEGLELAVATDHNHNTDYRPALQALGVTDGLCTVTGDEVSTPLGHFNAFPLDPARAPIDATLDDGHELFRRTRAETNAQGVVPLIQLNHPRLADIDWFGHTGLDPVTGTSADPRYAPDFDALEILNENLGLGYHDPVTDGVDTHGHAHSALVDWFHLLNRGARYAAVGNSDSHHVEAIVAGYPRNYVRVSHDDPATVSVAEVAAAVRAKQLFTTTGPFVEYTVEGVPMGGEARARDGHATLHVTVRAVAWVDCDRVKVFVNGDLAATLPIGAARTLTRLDQDLELCLLGQCARHAHRNAFAPGAHDAWVALTVEGDDALVPLLRPGAKPLAIANPLWIDGDGDGRWRAPHERITAELRALPTPALAETWFGTLTAEEQGLALAEAQRGPFAGVLAEAGLASAVRSVRLAAARAAERTVLAGALPVIQRLWNETHDDPFFGALLVRVLAGARRDQAGASVLAYAQRFGDDNVRRYAGELLSLFPAGAIPAWQVLGPLGVPAERHAAPPPPAGAELRERSGRALEWREHAPNAAGFVDLEGLGGESTDATLVYAQAFLRAEQARGVLCAFGSDDGARVWLGEKLVYENRAAKSANPLEALLTLELVPGWNRLTLEIENGTGGFGFYCRLLEAGLETSGAPR